MREGKDGRQIIGRHRNGLDGEKLRRSRGDTVGRISRPRYHRTPLPASLRLPQVVINLPRLPRRTDSRALAFGSLLVLGSAAAITQEPVLFANFPSGAVVTHFYVRG